MEKAKLQAVAKELNDLLGLDPAINPEAADAEISGKVAEAVTLLEKGDKLSADAVATLSELGHDDHLKRAGLLKAAKKAAKAEKRESGKWNKSVAGTQAAFIDSLLLKGVTKDEAAKQLSSSYNKNEAWGKGRFMIHIKHIQKFPDNPLKIGDDGIYRLV